MATASDLARLENGAARRREYRRRQYARRIAGRKLRTPYDCRNYAAWLKSIGA